MAICHNQKERWKKIKIDKRRKARTEHSDAENLSDYKKPKL